MSSSRALNALAWLFAATPNKSKVSFRAVLGVVAFLVTLTAVTAGRAQEATEKPTIAPLNPAFVQYMDDRAHGRVKEEWRLIPGGHPLGAIPSTIDFSYLKGQPGLAAQLGTNLPSSYDLRAQGRVSAVKDQGECGDCWAFATYGSMESALLPAESWDFSENNLNNLNGYGIAPCEGGNAQMSMAYLARWAGPINASDDPDPTSCTSESTCFNPSPLDLPPQQHVQGVYWIAGRASSTDNDNLKTAIMTYGGVDVGIWGEGLYSNSGYWNGSTDASYYNGDPVCSGKPCGADHNVTLVGWDDNYPAGNFSKKPPGNGAFLVKNSWGTYWGLSGFFWASYYDVVLAVGESYVFAGNELPSNYATNYQYDPLGYISAIGYNTTSAYAANIFTAAANSQLEAVATYATANNTTYTVEIYTNASSGPTSGSLATTTSGTMALAGYNTIVLPSPVLITKGQKFSVVIRLTTPGYGWPISFSLALTGNTIKATASPGNGFTSADGSNWEDITSWLDATASICLKAFANPATNALTLGSFSVSPSTTASGSTANVNIALSAAAPAGGTAISLTSSNPAVFPVPSTYTIPAGQTTAGPSVVAGTVTSSTTVTLTASYNGSSMQAQVIVNPKPSGTPVIATVSAILPQQAQTITITGRGFGTLAAYSGNSSYIAVNLPTWGAGYSGPGTNDAVGLAVTSWTDTKIVLAGFTGYYGYTLDGDINLWVNAGDAITLQIWNAQTGAGPSTCGNIVAGAGATTCLPPPAISVTPATTVAFDSVTLGSSSTQNFTVKNTGGGTLTGTASVAAPFSIASGGSYILAAGATQTVTVKFSPTAAQSYAQSVSFTGGAGASEMVTGTGAAAPAISVTPATTVAFGSVAVGASSTQNFTVKNTGGGTLTGTASVAAPFSIASGGSYSLAAGATQTVTVKFSPAAAQSYNQKVSFTGGAGTSRTITGTGVPAPAISVSPTTTVAFGSVAVGSSPTQNYTVENTGGGMLAGNASVAAPFSIASGASYRLAAGKSQTVTVKFSPAAAQSYSQKVSFTGGAGASRTVTGTGTAVASFKVSANKSSQTITQGQPASFTLTVQSKNGFHATVTPAALKLPTGYVASGTKWSPATVTPASNGTASSTLTVVTNASTTPGTYNVTLQAAAAGYTTQTAPVTITVNAAKKPTVTTGAATSITSSAATINGTVNPNGADTQAWFLINTTSSMSGAVECTPFDAGAGAGSVQGQCSLYEMSAASRYYYQFVAKNSAGTVYGSIKNFTTRSQSGVPAATSGAGLGLRAGSTTMAGRSNLSAGELRAAKVVESGAPPSKEVK